MKNHVLRPILIMAAILATGLTFTTTANAQSGSAGFTDLSQTDFDNAIRELSGNATYHSVTGAGTLGSVFGIEVGVVGGLTGTPEINTLSKRVDGSVEVGRLPHAAALIGVSVPMGFTGELLLFPEVSVNSAKYQQFGGSIKWTATEALVLPFNLAVRGFLTNNKMSFQQTLNNSSTGNVPVAVTVTQNNSQMGLQLLASPTLPIFEPYVGLGLIKANGKLAVSGATTGTIFAFTSAQSAESSPTTTQFLLGVNVDLVFLNLGLEYSRAFATNSYNFKLGFRF